MASKYSILFKTTMKVKDGLETYRVMVAGDNLGLI